ncbi:Gfo/Idh/MocA family protein [Paenibacillus solisilvae]|uniref:Gfo/Idh/MocA family protein n=1 Tax=Paenibacillus solisilvae TaxID=2486751 RepID=A0ABW0VXF9_9BACL
MTAVINIAVIGCGDIAFQAHFPSFLRQERIRVQVLCDPDREKLRRAADLFPESTVYTDSDDALLHPDIQASFILTPPAATPHLVMEALKRNTPVFCEKPMALQENLALQIIELEKKAAVPVQVGMKNSFHPLMTELRERICAGWFGSPVVYRIGVFDEVFDPDNTEHTGRIVRALQEGSPLAHEGAHVAEWLREFTDNAAAASVRADGVRSEPHWPSPNYVTASVSFDNGDLAQIDAGWLYPAFFRSSIDVFGPKGVARLTRAENTLAFRRLNEEEVITEDRDWNVLCFDRQLNHFIKCLDERLTPSPGTREALYGIRLIAAIEHELREGQAYGQPAHP